MGRRSSKDRGAGAAGAAACARVLLFAAVQMTARGAHGVSLQAPPGASNGQAVVVEEQPLVLSCTGEAPLRVSYPMYPGSLPEVKQSRATDGAGAERWNATVSVQRALRQNTGFYNCSSEADPRPASVYVYVRSADGQYPWVKDSGDAEKEEIMGQNSAFVQGTAVLDCRPNDPATQVHLLDGAGRQLTLGRQPDGSELTWDPRVGFRLRPVNMQHAGVYKCVVDEHHPKLKLTLNVVATSLTAPWVRQEGGGGGGWVRAGGNVSLVCELAVARRVNFSLSWRGPRGGLPHNDASRWEYFGGAGEERAWHRRGRTIFVSDASAADAGEYVCSAQDDHGNRQTSSLSLQVRDGEYSTRKPEIATNSKTHSVQHSVVSGGSGGSRGSGGASALVLQSAALLTFIVRVL